jgi:hypothetical protein
MHTVTPNENPRPSAMSIQRNTAKKNAAAPSMKALFHARASTTSPPIAPFALLSLAVAVAEVRGAELSDVVDTGVGMGVEIGLETATGEEDAAAAEISNVELVDGLVAVVFPDK